MMIELPYPDNWEPQESNCKLKDVKMGTAEWTKVEQLSRLSNSLREMGFKKDSFASKESKISGFGMFMIIHESECPCQGKSTRSYYFMAPGVYFSSQDLQI